MNTDELREEIAAAVHARNGKVNEQPTVDAIMEAVKNHMDWVVKEDEPESSPTASNIQDEQMVRIRNQLRQELRNRAGGY